MGSSLKGLTRRPRAMAALCWMLATLSRSSGRSSAITPACCSASTFCAPPRPRRPARVSSPAPSAFVAPFSFSLAEGMAVRRARGAG